MIWARQLPNLPTPALTSFSFGAGIQSTAILILLKTQPEIFTKAGLNLPSVAFWADTGAETKAVSDHVQRLMGWGLPLPLTIVRNHRNAEHLSEIQRPPWFLVNEDGTKGQVLRSCTDKWKIRPLERAMRAEAGFKKGQQMPTGPDNPKGLCGACHEQDEESPVRMKLGPRQVSPESIEKRNATRRVNRAAKAERYAKLRTGAL